MFLLLHFQKTKQCYIFQNLMGTVLFQFSKYFFLLEREPADDPKQKIRVLSEKIRNEVSIFNCLH